MREIKFRALFGKKWIYGSLVPPYKENCIVNLRTFFANLHVSSRETISTLSEYTSRKDKNVKEIYEGDLILISDELTVPVLDFGIGPTEPFNHIAPVVFQDGAFGVEIKENGNLLEKGFISFDRLVHHIGIGLDEFEVIGNIYENPELLD